MRRKDGIPIDVVLTTLERLYDPPRTFLEYRTPLDLLVATILSAQCTDARVNIVTRDILYPKYRTAKDYVRATRAQLEEDVHSCGTFRMKAKHVQEMCAMLIEKHGGEVPDTMEELVELPGVGRKTASIILYAIFGKNEGIAVDTHVLRQARRMGLSAEKDQAKIERDLLGQAPREKWGTLNTLLISHGRAVCTAYDRKCDVCPFMKTCPSSRVRGKPDLAKSDAKKPRGRKS